MVNGACARTASVGNATAAVAIVAVATDAVPTGATADGARAVVTGLAMMGTMVGAGVSATARVGMLVASTVDCTAMAAAVGVTTDDPPRPKMRYPAMARIATPSIAATPIKNASNSLLRLTVPALGGATTGGEEGY